jgi:hypothetical protein
MADDVADANGGFVVSEQIQNSNPNRIGKRFEPFGILLSAWLGQFRRLHFRAATRSGFLATAFAGHGFVISHDIRRLQYTSTNVNILLGSVRLPKRPRGVRSARPAHPGRGQHSIPRVCRQQRQQGRCERRISSLWRLSQTHACRGLRPRATNRQSS